MPTTAPILIHNTMRITDGHLDAFRAAIDRSVGFVEEHGPQLMVQVFVDEEAMLAHSFQLFADSDAVRSHWRLSDDVITEVMEHCSIDRFAVYGEPDAEVRDGLRSVLPDGAPTAPQAGFVRTG